jgi:hypothetical protein
VILAESTLGVTPPGAAPTYVLTREGVSAVTPEFGFLSRFSDDQLGILWKWGGLGELTGDPAAPYPGRVVMARFIQPIPGSWRDILRRAVRTMGNRPELAALRSLLLSLLSRPAGIALPAPAPLALSPQRRCHRFTPARAP